MAAQISSGRRVLKITEAKVYGSEAYVLLESGSVLNTLSKSFVDSLLVISKDTNNHINVSNGSIPLFWDF